MRHTGCRSIEGVPVASDMIVRIPQAEFSPLSQSDPRQRQPLIVHGHPGDAADQLVILVHGWGGGRYATWRRMASLLFSDLPAGDLGLYDYPSGRRRPPGTGPDLDRQAANLADSIRDCGYRSVALVCHSLGGLVARRAIADNIHSQAADSGGTPAVDRLAALFLCGTPMAGTRLVPGALRWTTPDLRWLAAHSREVTQTAKAFADRVVADPPAAPGQIVLPVYTLIGGRDRVVDEFSSAGSIPSARRLNTVEGHRSLIQPQTRDDQAYLWLLSHLRGAFAAHAERREQAAAAGTPPTAHTSSAAPAPRTQYELDVTTVSDGAHLTGAEHVGPDTSARIRIETIKGEGTKVIGVGEVGPKETGAKDVGGGR
jgi:pimeloyl-ACP methyl ester carboxylesterase